MEIRPTTSADLPAQYQVFRAAICDLYERHSFRPPDPPEHAFVAQQAHLLRHDGERCFVAEEDGELAGFAAALLREETWFFSSLFILPQFQGRGIGKQLLTRAWGAEATRRLTLTDAIQPASNGLYGKRGLIPSTPLLSLAGRCAIDAGDLEPASPDSTVVALLDRAAYGFDRAPDHSFWQARAKLTLWLRGGEPVAYSYAWPHEQVGPVAGLDARAAADALRAELGRRDEASVRAPGSSAELIGVALEAGLRMSATPGLLLLSREVVPPDALAISGYALL